MGLLTTVALLGLVGAFAYFIYLMMFGGGKKIKAYIWEYRGDKRLNFIGNDIVKNRKLSNGYVVALGHKFKGVWLRCPQHFMRKVKTMFGTVDEAFYLKVGRSYLPINPKVELKGNQQTALEKYLAELVEGGAKGVYDSVNDVNVYIPIPDKLGMLEYDLPDEDLSYELSTSKSMIETFMRDKNDALKPILWFAGFTMLIVGFILMVYFFSHNLQTSADSISAAVTNLGQHLGVSQP